MPAGFERSTGQTVGCLPVNRDSQLFLAQLTFFYPYLGLRSVVLKQRTSP
jgi:hypothetical protein